MGIQTQSIGHNTVGKRTRHVRHLGYYCIGPTITPAKIKALQRALVSDRRLLTAKQQLVALGGPRLDVLYLLTREPELCVCDLSDMLRTTVSAVSHQLRRLREHGLVATRRDAQTIFYALTPAAKRQLRHLWRTYANV